jgi:hypothetical protein
VSRYGAVSDDLGPAGAGFAPGGRSCCGFCDCAAQHHTDAMVIAQLYNQVLELRAQLLRYHDGERPVGGIETNVGEVQTPRPPGHDTSPAAEVPGAPTSK